MRLAPLMFVGHGSPMFALGADIDIQRQATDNLTNQIAQFDDVEAILVISPHWLTYGNVVLTNEHPETIYDFGGFPSELYQLKYPALGSRIAAKKIIDLLNTDGFETTVDNERGWDHGVWVPLRHLRPQADKPIVQLSLNVNLSVDELEKLGITLKQLRKQGIAVICSGSVTHNLHDLRMSHERVADYAHNFERWVRRIAFEGNVTDAKQPHIKSAHYAKSHPTSEHYLPLIVALAAIDDADRFGVLESPILHHSISMESYVWSQ
ncbi:dioxygenase [Vibrio sp. JPW-9-11-11]|uniref:DODA-type extradiol aromatic ring-opening family dioxygenase n=1 Tax=Vibrio sp. JPW-9-11-11 TaxID=1416532 RepID=UPI001594550F|nr:class III extradiol ring-cleavage dioxygenase [Vibrio sp. JPW-9-11-11]NVD08749.1 dioxygenase [Vibrio sp. JPW-9-11-11]